MKIRNKIKNSKRHLDTTFRQWLRPKVKGFSNRYRIAARIRLANIRAKKHPKKTFFLVSCSLLVIFFSDLAMTVFGTAGSSPGMEGITKVEPLFEGFRTIQANKDQQRKSILEMVAKGQELKSELDSMIAIPVKSRQDSIIILQKYSRLEKIANSLKDDNNEEN
ncbi:MAG: hypothetical protein J1F16_11090 [Muribaculaceae bacterium]|nr:hypothetical protein [Muribaculaceae bacterium]